MFSNVLPKVTEHDFSKAFSEISHLYFLFLVIGYCFIITAQDEISMWDSWTCYVLFVLYVHSHEKRCKLQTLYHMSNTL